MFHRYFVDHEKVNVYYSGFMQLQDLRFIGFKVILVQLEQETRHATSKPPTVGQLTTFKIRYFSFEFSFLILH